MVPCLLSSHGDDYILSERLSQDPLEFFVGRQRAAGCRSDNPILQQFCKNTVSLRFNDLQSWSLSVATVGKTISGKDNNISDLTAPLLKRPRNSKHRIGI